MPGTPWLGGLGTVTQGFGACELAGDCPHTGIDVGVPAGTPIIDQIAGVIRDVVDAGGFGLHQIIDLGGGRQILLGHESGFAVPSGTEVMPGEVIGYVGSTGFSTGPHVHFEEDIGGVPVDPSSLLFSPGQGGLPNPVQVGTSAGQRLRDLAEAELGAAILAVPGAIGHGLAGALGAGVHDATVFVQRQIIALAVAAVVLLVLFVR